MCWCHFADQWADMDVSENSGVFPPNHPIFNGIFHYLHHPFWGFPPIFGNTHICKNTQNISKHSRWCSPPNLSWSTPNFNNPKNLSSVWFHPAEMLGSWILISKSNEMQSKGNLKKSHHARIFSETPFVPSFFLLELSCVLPTQRLKGFWHLKKSPQTRCLFHLTLNGPERWEDSHSKFGWWFHPIKMATIFMWGKYTSLIECLGYACIIWFNDNNMRMMIT